MRELIERGRILICAGSGGVGKTTTAAAVALAAARAGRRAVVVTVDPARRLADALGLGAEGLGNEPRRIELADAAESAGDAHGDRGGELWAMMLDTNATFDGLVRRYSADPAQRDRILTNRFYRNISGALSGTQEYMAAEKLYELHADERFDLVIVDTPPTRNALNFLDAPERLVRFLDHRLYRALTAPSRFGLRIANVATQTVLRLITPIVGGEVLDDVITFFQAFSGMEDGFRSRAKVVIGLLADPSTHYVLVASPRRDTVDEASYFADQLRLDGRAVSALVINRLHPRFGDSAAITGDDDVARNARELAAVAAAEEAAVEPLIRLAGEAIVARVPLFDGDVNTLTALSTIGGSLVGGERR